MRPPGRVMLRVLALPAALGCGHGEPFSFEPPTSAGARTSGPLVQVTYNTGDDLDPVWLPDGSGFLYTVERTDRPERDRCLALMGPAGGTIRRLICDPSPFTAESIEVFEGAAPAPDGRLAYVYTTFDLRRLTPPRWRGLVLATLETPAERSPLFIFPYTAPGGFRHYSAAYVRWLDERRLAYRAITPHYPQPCKVCRPDAATPVQLIVADLAGDTAVAQPVPNSFYPTGLAAAGGDTLFYTVLGDGRIYRHVLSSGADDVVYDFGLGTIARDVQVAGDRLVAVVGGNVSIEFLVGLGYIQNDDGGEIHVVDRRTLAARVPYPGFLFRRAALSPDGRVVLAEARTDGSWDIWRVELP